MKALGMACSGSRTQFQRYIQSTLAEHIKASDDLVPNLHNVAASANKIARLRCRAQGKEERTEEGRRIRKKEVRLFGISWRCLTTYPRRLCRWCHEAPEVIDRASMLIRFEDDAEIERLIITGAAEPQRCQ